jgi:myo-inositol-1(or 4)-monophosphatase
MSALLDRALRAAQRAATLLLEERPDVLLVESKSTATDAVTEMDRASEALLVADLVGDGGDGVLGEEGGERPGVSGVRWVLDPLDGTVNYLYRLPVWAVSVAAEQDGAVVAAVVAAPELGLTWYATAGQGAWRVAGDGPARRLHVGSEADLGRALIGTGFGYDAADRIREAQRLAGIIGRVRDVRRAGAAAVDMCWVADGTLDGYFEEGTHHWDRAAAGLIVREAGGALCDTAGGPPTDAMTIAANPTLAPALADLLRD